MYSLRYASSFLKEAKKDSAIALSCGRPNAENDCLTPHFFIIRFSNDNISGNDMDFRREIDITCQLYFASGPSMMEIQLI